MMDQQPTVHHALTNASHIEIHPQPARPYHHTLTGAQLVNAATPLPIQSQSLSGRSGPSSYTRAVDGIDILEILEFMRAVEQRRLAFPELTKTQPRILHAIVRGVAQMEEPGTKSLLATILSQSWVSSVLLEHLRYLLRHSAHLPPGLSQQTRQDTFVRTPVSLDCQSRRKLKITITLNSLTTGPTASAGKSRRSANSNRDKPFRSRSAVRKISPLEPERQSRRCVEACVASTTDGLRCATGSKRLNASRQGAATVAESCSKLRRSLRQPRWNAKALLFWDMK